MSFYPVGFGVAAKPTTPNIPHAPGTIESIKAGASNAAHWLGRQIVAVKDAVMAAITKIINLVRPVLANLGSYFVKAFEAVKVWVKLHQDIAIPVGIGAAVVAAFAALVIYNRGSEPATNQSAVKV